jgi:Domain of unknown function (DUF5102)
LTWSGSPTLDRLLRIHSRRNSTIDEADDAGPDNGFGNDFDDFEEGAQAGEDDEFGDFDDGFEGPSATEEASQPSPLSQDEPRPTFVSRRCFSSSQSIVAGKYQSSASHAYFVIADLIF